MTEAEFGELIEAMLFWLIGLLAPALVGLKAAAMAGMSPRPRPSECKEQLEFSKATLFIDPVGWEVATHCTDGAGEVRRCQRCQMGRQSDGWKGEQCCQQSGITRRPNESSSWECSRVENPTRCQRRQKIRLWCKKVESAQLRT